MKSEKRSKIIVIIIIVIIASWGIWKISKRRKYQTSFELISYWHIPDFNLTRSTGKIISSKELNGNICVINFFHRNCGNLCKKLYLQMSMLQKSVENHKTIK